MLVSEGAMSWDSPISNQLPAFALRDIEGAQRLTLSPTPFWPSGWPTRR
jgi:beta-lactamase class C